MMVRMEDRPTSRDAVKRALYGGHEDRVSRRKRRRAYFNRDLSGDFSEGGYALSGVTCESRFHNRDHGGTNNWAGNRIQCVCYACRQRWLERSITAEQINEELIQEGLEAARTLIQMARDGLISIENLPENPGTDSSRSDSTHTLSSSEDDLDGDVIPDLPLSAFSAIFDRTMDVEPRCALELLVLDWNTCEPDHPTPERSQHLTRIVTYTRETGSRASKFTAKSGHGRKHILLPMKALDNRLVALNKWCCDETVRIYFQKGTQVFQLSKDTLPEDIAEDGFVLHTDETFPIRGKALRKCLPFDDDSSAVGNQTTPFGKTYLFKLLRHLVVHSPLTLMEVSARNMVDPELGVSEENLDALDMAIDLDRATPIWLSWSQMPRLESVLLDLRIYSHNLNTDRGCIGKDEIIKRAQEMGRCLNLKLLVLAGLQSYDFVTKYEGYTVGDIEDQDEINGEPNWIKIFRPAIRPGGRIILIDRLEDN